MARKRMFWRLAVPFLFVILISLVATTLFSFRSIRQMYIDQTTRDLQSRAVFAREHIVQFLADPSFSTDSLARIVDDYCDRQGDQSSTRITVMLPSGIVVGDSEEDPSAMEDHASRPEMTAALDGRSGTSIRFSNTLQVSMMYVAIPITVDGHLAGVVRTSVPLAAVETTLGGVLVKFIFAGVAIALLAGVLSFYISRRISAPLEELKKGAELFARGEFGRRLFVPDSEEIGSLAEAMNSMASQLDERLSTVVRQRNEREAILSSMVEGVIAVDKSRKIMNLNRAAEAMIGCDRDRALGRNMEEVVRNPHLQELVTRTLTERAGGVGQIVVNGNGERFLQVTSTVLEDGKGENIGALIVLNDVTRLKKLENIRRDFVANVSHELKTPITSIKGFVETLRDGAIENRGDADKFLAIIGKQADRLGSIIEDLLSLSRLEQEAESGGIEKRETGVKGVLQAAILACQHKADKKNIEIVLDCDFQLKAAMNAQLFEQAMVNLLDNAITYSAEGGKVMIRGESDDDEVAVKVIDHGYGIKEEHLPRLFERFYRVDRARSREMGGTGLGLAIVKHIMLVHGGTVSVESTYGTGSTFTVALPRS